MKNINFSCNNETSTFDPHSFAVSFRISALQTKLVFTSNKTHRKTTDDWAFQALMKSRYGNPV